MSAAAIPELSVFHLEVREFHEFTPEELAREDASIQTLPERPFDKMDRTSDYVFHLPDQDSPNDSYPWEDRKWQGEWFWQRGGISRAEAYFWFMALSHPSRITDTKRSFAAPRDLRRIRHGDVDDFGPEDAKARLKAWFAAMQKRPARMVWFQHAHFTRFLRELMPLAQVLDVLFDVIPGGEVRHFFSHLMPEPPTDESSDDEVARWRALEESVDAHLSSLTYDGNDTIYTAIRLLECVPREEQALRLCQELVDSTSEVSPTAARDAVNCLHEPANFAEYFALLDQYAIAKESIPFLVERGGFEVVDALMRRVCKRDAAFQIAVSKDIIRVHTHHAVRGFLELYHDSPVSPMAYGWLVSEGANAIKGLIPLANSRTSITHLAQRILREYRDRGHLELIEQILDEFPDSVRQDIDEHVLAGGTAVREVLAQEEWPEWMERLVTAKPRKYFPKYIDLNYLPELVTTDRAHVLGPRVVEGILNRIVASTPEKVDPVLLEVRDFLQEESRHDFAWHLFQFWCQNGYQADEKYLLWALGFLGTELSCAKLAPKLDEWTTARHTPRAVWGLHVYRLVGTDAALTRLHRISQRARSKALRDHAVKMLDQVAVDRELTRDELDDLIVPDCGLDDRGRRVFDYGSRSFTMFLDEDLNPRLVDASGKVRKSLPPLRKSDDAQAVADAKASWKLYTGQIKDTVKVQRSRLEAAMVSQRRWGRADFERVIVNHPLMTNFAQRILWGVFSKTGKLLDAFRVTDEHELADIDDDPFDLPPQGRVGVVHPLYLSREQLQRWGSLFGEYEITPPFAQLERPVFDLDAGQLVAKTLDEFIGASVDGLTLRGRLENRDWRRIGGDYFSGLFRRFSRQHLIVTLNFSPGLPSRWDHDHAQVELTALWFARDPGRDVGLPGRHEAMTLETVSNVVLSEVIYDLRSLTDEC